MSIIEHPETPSRLMPLVVAACFGATFALGGCQTNRAAPEESAEGSLDMAPYRVRVDAEKARRRYEATLDLSKFDPKKELTIFMRSSDEPGEMYLVDPESHEQIAEAKQHGSFEDEDGEQYVAVVKVNPDLYRKLDLVAQVPVDAHMWLFLFCDEIVENRADVGAGSLRQAIADVQNSGSVCFDPVEFGTFAGPVQLSAEILVGRNVHILGTGRTASQVEAGRQDRIFQFGIGTDSSIHDLGINDGASDEGGLIKNRGTLEIADCELHSGEADRGGAVYNEGDLFVVGSTVSSSNAEHGGGIYNDDGLVDLADASVTSNQATYGGGVYGTSASFRLREGSLVTQNQASEGGGLYIDDHGISGYNGIWGGSIDSNTATRGGGVYMRGGQLEIDFNPRQAGEPTAIAANLAEDGGGIYVALGATLDVKLDNSIWGNGAQNDAGGIYNAGHVTLHGAAMVEQNQADQHGGGVYNTGELEMMGQSRIAGNAATHSGGGVYNASTGSVKLWDRETRIEGNAAVAGGGSGAGGGVLNEAGGMLDYLLHEIVNNTPNDVVNLP
jgi:predicted outer membrane repeat protein